MSGTILDERPSARSANDRLEIELDPADLKPAQTYAEWLGDIRQKFALPSAPEHATAHLRPEVVHRSEASTPELPQIDVREIVVATASYGISVACQVIALGACLLPFGMGVPISKPLVQRIFPDPARRR